MTYRLTIEWLAKLGPNEEITWEDSDSLGNLIRVLIEELGADRVLVKRSPDTK